MSYKLNVIALAALAITGVSANAATVTRVAIAGTTAAATAAPNALPPLPPPVRPPVRPPSRR